MKGESVFWYCASKGPQSLLLFNSWWRSDHGAFDVSTSFPGGREQERTWEPSCQCPSSVHHRCPATDECSDVGKQTGETLEQVSALCEWHCSKWCNITFLGLSILMKFLSTLPSLRKSWYHFHASTLWWNAARFFHFFSPNKLRLSPASRQQTSALLSMKMKASKVRTTLYDSRFDSGSERVTS